MSTLGGVREVEGCANSAEIDSLARFAVDEHNKKQFGKVISAKKQVVSGTLYYITLEAIDGEKKEVYQAKVWEKPWLQFKELQEFKLVDGASSA